MPLFMVAFGVLALTIGVYAAFRPDYFGNVGFLIIGATLGVYPVFVVEEYRRRQQHRALSRAIFHELADRAARCCFDFENPWHSYLSHPQEMAVRRLQKFAPVMPVIYPAAGIALGTLKSAQPIITFYYFLSAWKRDIEATVEDCIRRDSPVGTQDVAFLAKRLLQTLLPAMNALRVLGDTIGDSDVIEREAISELDRLFPNSHPNAGKTIQERIEVLLTNATIRTGTGEDS